MLIKKKKKYPCDWFCGPGSHLVAEKQFVNKEECHRIHNTH